MTNSRHYRRAVRDRGITAPRDLGQNGPSVLAEPSDLSCGDRLYGWAVKSKSLTMPQAAATRPSTTVAHNNVRSSGRDRSDTRNMSSVIRATAATMRAKDGHESGDTTAAMATNGTPTTRHTT
jgi:hypothetical protein